MKTFADILDLWPSAGSVAADLADQGVEVKDGTVRSWRRLGIPGAYWDLVAAAARRRAEAGQAGFEAVTLDLLCSLGSKVPRQPDLPPPPAVRAARGSTEATANEDGDSASESWWRRMMRGAQP